MACKIAVSICMAGALALSACGAPPDGRTDPEVIGSVAQASSGTVTLTASSNTSGGYDFSTQTFTGLSGGDFYYSGGGFWANNVGQRGVVKVGTCSSVDSVTAMPTTGYTRFGVTAAVGNCFVSLTHNDERDYIVFRVTAQTSTTVTLAWKTVATGWWGATLTDGSNSSAGYDFDAKTYKGASGGDLYFSSGAFWANNVGQRGTVSVGPCSTVDAVAAVPQSGYWRAGTALTAGNCYVSLRQNEERGDILIRVDTLTSVTASITFKLVDDCYGLTDFTKHVNCWLSKNSAVAQRVVWEKRVALGSSSPVAWAQWTNAQQDDLRNNVGSYEKLLANTLTQDPDPLVDPPTNLETLSDTEFPVLVLSTNDAWRLYVKTAAMSLATELSKFVPWSVTGYGATSLSALFDSRNMLTYTWSGRPANLGVATPQAEGYMAVLNAYDNVNHTTLTPGASYTTPPPPDKALQFVRAQSFKGSTRKATIQNALEWSRRLRHFTPSPNTAGFQRVWQYRGPAPVSRTIATTVDPSFDATNPFHFTAGCHGTSEFLHSVLRTLNIPVDENNVVLNLTHSITRFTTENLYLSHADDPYYLSDPYGIPASAMLITDATYRAWFVNATNPVLSEDLGRQNLENWIANLSPKLQYFYCGDPPGTAPANSAVLALFSQWPHIYTLSYLQNLPTNASNPQPSLWDRLASKVAAGGGCSVVTSSIVSQMNACTAVRPVAESLATCTWN